MELSDERLSLVFYGLSRAASEDSEREILHSKEIGRFFSELALRLCTGEKLLRTAEERREMEIPLEEPLNLPEFPKELTDFLSVLSGEVSFALCAAAKGRTEEFARAGELFLEAETDFRLPGPEKNEKAAAADLREMLYYDLFDYADLFLSAYFSGDECTDLLSSSLSAPEDCALYRKDPEAFIRHRKDFSFLFDKALADRMCAVSLSFSGEIKADPKKIPAASELGFSEKQGRYWKAVTDTLISLTMTK